MELIKVYTRVRRYSALAGFILCLRVLFPNSSSQCANGEELHFYQTDLDALQGLLAAWNKSNLSGWKSKNAPDFTNPCSNYTTQWDGVQCLKKKQDVTNTSISDVWVIKLNLTVTDLMYDGVIGMLPPAIGDLTSLMTLSLVANPYLTGILPQELGNLANSLSYLDLHNNSFTGTIPARIANLTLLENLDLSANKLSGSVPIPFTANTQSLRNINLSHNELTGATDFLQSLGNYFYLTLDVSNNNLSGSLPQFEAIQNLDLSNNKLSGSLPNLTLTWFLQTLNLSRNQFSGSVSILLKHTNVYQELVVNQPTVAMLDMSYNNLTAPIPDLHNLNNLRTLYLDNNNFNGILDLGNGNLSFDSVVFNGISVRPIVSIMNNNITQINYNGLSVRSITATIKLQGNPYCRDYNNKSTNDLQRCLCEQYCYDTVSNASPKQAIVVASTVSASFTIVLVTLISIFLYWRSNRYTREVMDQLKQKFAEHELKPTLFSYRDIQRATQDFSSHMKLGQGGFGAVYKGFLPNDGEVAVKQLFAQNQQSVDDFLNEVIALTSVKHKNLVKLKGCCLREDQRLLVCEFVENNDVSHALLEHRSECLFSWPIRMNICLGVARGLQYLHESVEPRIIHRDIKAANILLDKELQPKIADFGLALLFPNEQTHITAEKIAGTRGYSAPEYVLEGRISEKIDVFSYGVVVLEVVSGRKNINTTLEEHKVYLPKWAWKMQEEGAPLDIVDPTLQPLNDEEQLSVLRVIKIALLCVHDLPERRPTMSQVILMLQEDLDVVGVDRKEQIVPLVHPFAKKSSFAMSRSGIDRSFANDPDPDSCTSPLYSTGRTSSFIEMEQL